MDKDPASTRVYLIQYICRTMTACNACWLSTATFDIQNPRASKDGSNITVEGEFINTTLATGCFIVIQGHSSNADIYRALLRRGSEQTMSEVISVPTSNYTVYAYDLEENALPNPLPAVSSGTTITIKSDC